MTRIRHARPMSEVRRAAAVREFLTWLLFVAVLVEIVVLLYLAPTPTP